MGIHTRPLLDVSGKVLPPWSSVVQALVISSMEICVKAFEVDNGNNKGRTRTGGDAVKLSSAGDGFEKPFLASRESGPPQMNLLLFTNILIATASFKML